MLNAGCFFEKGGNKEMLFLVKGSAEKCAKQTALTALCTDKRWESVSALKTWKEFYWDALEVSVATGTSVAIITMGVPFTFTLSFPTKPLERRRKRAPADGQRFWTQTLLTIKEGMFVYGIELVRFSTQKLKIFFPLPRSKWYLKLGDGHVYYNSSFSFR